MSRFVILALLARMNRAVTCVELARLCGLPGWFTRSFRASLNSRLRRLRRWGLVKRKLVPWLKPARASCGVYVWTISERGKLRLQWARKEGKL